MDFDFKTTIWERVNVPEEKEQEVLEGIKNGSITSANDITDIIDEADCNVIYDTSEQMTLIDNGGNSTIEIYEEGENIFENGES